MRAANEHSLGDILGIVLEPVVRAYRRLILRIRLDHSAKVVDVMNQRVKNDLAALRSFDLQVDMRTMIETQITEWRHIIATEHARQASLNSDLFFLQ